MTANEYNPFTSDSLSMEDFRRLSAFIGERTGIKMPPAKRSMVESRLRKRLCRLSIRSYREYCDFLFSPNGMDEELPRFINAITTNKTDFFREPGHFEFLGQKAVPKLAAALGSGLARKLMIWSAAASTGNEAYSLAMTMSEFNRRYPGMGLDWSILASDISTRVLKKGERAIYDAAEAIPIPEPLKKRYLLRSRDRSKELVRIVPELRHRVRFRRINLMAEEFRLREPMDIIFCRNVIIYFDQETQDGLVRRLCRNIRRGGYLFMGHSELLNCRNLPLVSVAPSVYRRT